MPSAIVFLRLPIAVAAILLLLALAASTANASDLYVEKIPGATPPAYSSLDQALAAAADGDTIYLGNGDIGLSLTIDKNVTIRGTRPYRLIDGSLQQNPGGWNITAPGCTLLGLAFYRWPVAPVIVNAANCTIDRCWFEDCNGGVLLESGNAAVNDSYFNRISGDSFVTRNGTDTFIESCGFWDCGGDVLIRGSGTNVFNCTFYNASIRLEGEMTEINNASIQSGQIKLNGSQLTMIHGCEIDGSRLDDAVYDCIATTGGINRYVFIYGCDLYDGKTGVSLNDTDALFFNACNITGHRDSGIALWNTTRFMIIGCNVSGNALDGIDISQCTEGRVSNNTIAGSGRYGIGLESAGHVLVSECNITDNPAGISLDRYTNNTTFELNRMANVNNIDEASADNRWNSTEMYNYTFNRRNFTNYTGNYWGNYTGADSSGDGIGDKAYVNGPITDYYPLTNWPLEVVWPEDEETGVTPAPSPTPKPAPGPALPVIGLTLVAGLLLAVRKKRNR